MFVSAAYLQRRFGLPRALASEIVTEGMQHALRHRWQPWAWVLAWLGTPAISVGLGWFAWPALHRGGVFILIVAFAGWCLLAQWLAGEVMLAAAADKARRIGSVGHRP